MAREYPAVAPRYGRKRNLTPKLRATTVVGVLHNGQVALGTHGQASVAKKIAHKVRVIAA